MKNFVKGLILVGVLGLGVLIGANTNKVEKVEVSRILTQSEDGVYIDQGEQYIELSDGSWIIYGNGNYIFQPVDLGDWDYQVENEEQLENLVKTYISIKNTEKY